MRMRPDHMSNTDLDKIVKRIAGAGHRIDPQAATELYVVRSVDHKKEPLPSEPELDEFDEFIVARLGGQMTPRPDGSPKNSPQPPAQPAAATPACPPKVVAPVPEFDESAVPYQDYDTPLHLDVGLVDDNWIRVPEAGCMQGFCVIGAPGSGKTAGVMYPLLHQLIGHPSRPGGLILEVKGNFSQKLREYCKRYGREKDIVEIRPGGSMTYNPLHTDAPAEFLASRLTEAIINLQGGMDPREAFWIQSAEDVARNIIRLKRMTTKYVTMQDIFQLAVDDSRLAEEINDLHTLVEAREVMPEDADGVFMWNQKWSTMEPRMKNSIVGEVTRFTNLFVDSKEFRKTFCPSRDEITFAGFEDCINKGKIVLLDMPPQKYGNPSLSVATLMKLDYFDTVLRRTMAENDAKILQLYKVMIDEKQKTNGNKRPEGIQKILDHIAEEFLTRYSALREQSDRGKFGYAQRLQMTGLRKKILRSVQEWLRYRTAKAGSAGVLNKERPVFFICDEYQNFITCGGLGTMKADNLFYDRSRESRCVSIVAFQDYTSLTQKFRSEVVMNILACLQNKFYLRMDCPYSASRAALSCRTSGTTKFQENDFMELSAFTAVFRGSDGANVIGPMRMDLMKNFEFDRLIGPLV